MNTTHHIICAAIGIALTLTVASPALAAPRQSPAPAPSLEDIRVDRVKVPGPKWTGCWAGKHNAAVEKMTGALDCTTMSLPLDYDEPTGAKVSVSVARRPANSKKPDAPLLFINPGGPGAGSWDLLAASSQVFSQKILDTYTIVAVEPRGVGGTPRLKCFGSEAAQSKVLRSMPDRPETPAEISARLAGNAAIAKACLSPSSISRTMSTFEFVRDMEVTRRVLGSAKFNFYGFSYGSFVGQAYANMFPQRAGKIVIDGVVDANSWTGQGKLGTLLLEERLGSAKGSDKAMQQAIDLCAKAGPKCKYAKTIASEYKALVAALQKSPLAYTRDGKKQSLTLAAVGNWSNDVLRQRDAAEAFVEGIHDMYVATNRAAMSDATAPIQLVRAIRGVDTGPRFPTWARPNFSGISTVPRPDSWQQFETSWQAAQEYAYGFDAHVAVTCTDGRHNFEPEAAAKAALTYSAAHPISGAAWAWQSTVCSKPWSGVEEDTFAGTYSATPSEGMLAIGNLWDPATNVDQAREVPKHQKNTALLVSDNWGHTAYGTSRCVNDAVDDYLIKGKLRGGKCSSEYQPFTGQQPSEVR